MATVDLSELNAVALECLESIALPIIRKYMSRKESYKERLARIDKELELEIAAVAANAEKIVALDIETAVRKKMDFPLLKPPVDDAGPAISASVIPKGFMARMPSIIVTAPPKFPSPPKDRGIRRTLIDSLGEVHTYTPPVPDLIAPIIAWRAWMVKDRRLRPIGELAGKSWSPKHANKAYCVSVGNKHNPPVGNCSCGYWAFHTLDELKEAISKYCSIPVIGKVYLWGRVLECEKGYRAEYAYPAELWLLRPNLDELGGIYNVPIRTLQNI